jgi:hypothetical protein
MTPGMRLKSQSSARHSPGIFSTTATPSDAYLTIGANDTGVEIVGIAKGSKYSSVREKPPRFLYVPFEQADAEFTRQSAFFVRIQTPERSLMTAVRGAMQQLDPGVPIDRLSSMQVLVDDSIYRDRLIATLAAVFGVLATILAAVGLYGTVSYSVTRRTREFGIRLALGAVPQTLLRTVLHEVGWLVAVGVAFGLPLSYALARLVESQFYGIRAHDVWVLVGSTLLICLVAFVAGLLPAMRATRIDPVRALRYE